MTTAPGMLTGFSIEDCMDWIDFLCDDSPVSSLDLRDYQRAAIDDLRSGLRDGHQRQILCAPTGSGKTEMAIHLIQEALAKRSRVLFICDRRILVEQTSQRLAGYGIPHGVYMARQSFGRSMPVQVASAQTIEAADRMPDADVIIIDEAHTQRKAILEACRASDAPLVGLTATPLTLGLTETYTRVVNATVTNRRIEHLLRAPCGSGVTRFIIRLESGRINPWAREGLGVVEKSSGLQDRLAVLALAAPEEPRLAEADPETVRPATGRARADQLRATPLEVGVAGLPLSRRDAIHDNHVSWTLR